MIREPQISRDPLDLLLDTLEPKRTKADPTWRYTGQVLVIRQTSCSCCGRVYMAPLHILTLSMDDKGATRQTTNLAAFEESMGVPKTTNTIQTIIPSCQECWQ